MQRVKVGSGTWTQKTATMDRVESYPGGPLLHGGLLNYTRKQRGEIMQIARVTGSIEFPQECINVKGKEDALFIRCSDYGEKLMVRLERNEGAGVVAATFTLHDIVRILWSEARKRSPTIADATESG